MGQRTDGETHVVRQGDPPAVVRSFFDAALDAVYPYLFRRCGGDRSVAEDLTQETFLSAVRALRDGKVEEISVGWMVTVAQSRLIDHYRAEGRRARHLRAVADDERTADDVETVVVGDELVAEMLRHLPPDQRLVVVLHHLDGVPIREIARRTGRTVRAVESSLARARRALRAMADPARGDRDG